MATVLIIDDETEIGNALRRVLERAGYVVTTASIGAEVLAQSERQPADVVITDILMPRMHGVGVIEASHSHDVRMSRGRAPGGCARRPHEAVR